jgi:hypothetical protein
VTPERAQRLQSLKGHPVWEELRAEVQETHDAYSAALAKKMLADGKPFESPDMSFEFKRGYLKGLMDCVRIPDKAVLALQKDLKKHQSEEEPVEQ